jgi:hypothetical protein
LGKMEFIFSLYDKTRWKWYDVYLLWGCQIYSPWHTCRLHYPCISIHLPSLLEDVHGACD